MGIESELPAVPSLTLGTADVTPIEMASAYQTLANDGKHCEPFAVAKVVERQRRAVPAQTVVQAGRLTRDRAPRDRDDARAWSPAGRARRPRSARGRWRARPGRRRTTRTPGSCGFTRQVSTAVWVGFPGTPDRSRTTSAGRCSVARWPRRSGTTTCCSVMAGMPAESFPARRHRRTVRCPTWSDSDPSAHRTSWPGRTSTPLVETVDSAEPRDRAGTDAGRRRVCRARVAGHDPGQQRRPRQGEDAPT